MKKTTCASLLVSAGFLAGSLGLKLLTSATAKRGYVHVVAQGIRAKNAYQDIVEQAKAEVDDIVAEATYLAEAEKPAAEAPATTVVA